MKPHKWAKEIKAWADGAEIEFRNNLNPSWTNLNNVTKYPEWHEDTDYRIKPQPKEPKYLYVYERKTTGFIALSRIKRNDKNYDLICRVKVENDDLPTTI